MSADNRPSHEIASDKPGREFANPGGNQQRHAMPPSTDPHRHAQDEFVADVVNWLTDKRNHNRFENLVVIAPPRIMGEMRNKMPKPLAETVEGEITKDLTNIPVQELPRHLSGTAGWL